MLTHCNLSELGISDMDFIRESVVAVQTGLVHVLTHHWTERFSEVEWPVLVLLHLVKELVEAINKSSIPLTLPDWPSTLLKSFEETNEKASLPLFCPDFDLALMVWLGWDTDETDVDLHVKEPSGTEVFFQQNRGTASMLSRDFTRGYGPEVYIMKKGDGTLKGKYEVFAKYFASHQDSALTGTTSAVVWTIESKSREDSPKSIRDDNTNVLHLSKQLGFNFVRLDTHKEKTHVATATIP